MNKNLVFIGGGNMASAIIGGLLKQGCPAQCIDVIEPLEATRRQLHERFGVRSHAQPGDFLRSANLVLWAVKPQTMQEACAQCRPFLDDPLHLSIAAGVRSDSLARWLGSERIVRAMPNTPALVGQGVAGLFARAAVTPDERHWIDAVLSSTGALMWFDTETQLDVVTALSGSGPAYVFFFMEAMITAGIEMGLTRAQSQQLAVATVSGAGALAAQSPETPRTLRERVTSKGGTTHAAISVMEDEDLQATWINAIYAARERATQMGAQFSPDGH